MIQTKRNGNRYEWVIPLQWAKWSLEKLMKDHWRAPKKLVHELRMEKSALINGEVANWTRPFTVGDILSLPLFKHDNEPFAIATPMSLEILYEDDHLLIINKPAGMDTHPNHDDETQTLLNGVIQYVQEHHAHSYVRHVHRLDHDTTGAILFAKHRLAGAILDTMLEARQIKRTYVALVHGHIKHPKGTIADPIGRDRHHATRRRVSPTGQKAVTHYQVLSHLDRPKLSLISCQLDTGRTHQIRVHLSSIGHPLAGDVLYGGKAIFPRQALHAAKLEFVHPFTEESIVCYAPFPDHESIFPQKEIADLF